MVWFPKHDERPDWSEAERHLAAVDPVLAKLMPRVGPCTLQPRRDYFVVLCLSIWNQQIAMKTAETLFARFCARFPRKTPTPARVHAALTGEWDDETIRHCGISRQKRGYLIDLSARFVAGDIPTRRLPSMSDDEIAAVLTETKGIGRWTAEMFLMFTLNRPDVLPVDDLGLQEAIKVLYGLPARPKPKEIAPMAEPWRPWRTVATWYCWRGKGYGGGNDQ